MVYIYKKIAGGKSYYYLRASKRKGSKVIAKDLAYLGNSIDKARKAIGKLSKYKKETRKAYKNINLFLEANHYLEKAKSLKLKKNEFLGEKLEEVEACKIHYEKVFNSRDKATKVEILRDFLIEFAFNTTSIEGNTINLQDARNLLAEGLTPKDKTLREIYDLQNTEKVFFELLETQEELNHEFVIRVHDTLMENIDSRNGYRTTDVRVLKSNFDATPAPYVKTDMTLLLEWYKKNKEKLHSLSLAAIFHHKFEKIHPFMDGNGRTGRMLFNYILIKSKYPPVIIHKKTHVNYLEELRTADRSNLTANKKEDYADLVKFVANEMIITYWNLFL